MYYQTLYYDAEKARKIAVSDREKQQIAFEQLSHQMQTILVLDAQYTKELEHDKNLIAQLERDVADGRRRLQINAICPAVPTGRPPPAWMMQPMPDLLTPLNEIISPSDDESKLPSSK